MAGSQFPVAEMGQGALLNTYTTATASAAPTVLIPSGFNAGGAIGSSKGLISNLTDNLNGSIAIPPGGSFWPLLANGVSAPTMTFLICIDVIQTPFYAAAGY